MEPVWKLTESVLLDEQFSLLQSFGLASAADAFVWSDFLGEPTYIGRHTKLSGRFTDEQRLSGRFTDEQRLEGDA